MSDSFELRTSNFIAKTKAHPKAKRVFIHGDSWFELPGGHYKGRSVVQWLNNDTWVRAQQGDNPVTVAALSVARVGLKIRSMVADRNMRNALGVVADAGIGWDAICVSGGGNDLLDKVDELFDGNGQLVERVLAHRLDSISDSWDLFDALFMGSQMDVPVVTHGYGLITPTLTASTMLMGFWKKQPWVGPWLLGKLKLSPADAKALTDVAINRLNDTLQARMANRPKFTVLDLRDLVEGWQPGDWHDEIHPFAPGFEAIAQKVLQMLLSKWSDD